MARSPDQPTSTAKSRRRRDDLLDAARRAFEKGGYVGTGVADIARAAGGSRASFYSYFTSKDDVLGVLVRDLTEDLVAAATMPVERTPTTFEDLSSSIRQFMHAYRDRAPLLLVLDQATTVSADFMELRRQIRGRFAASLEQALVRRRQRRPDPDGLDPRMTALALGGMVEDLARGRYLFGQEIDEEQAVHTLAVLWARSLGVRTPGSPQQS